LFGQVSTASSETGSFWVHVRPGSFLDTNGVATEPAPWTLSLAEMVAAEAASADVAPSARAPARNGEHAHG
jgi:hypothetical protein